jgi:hypothetical protein
MLESVSPFLTVCRAELDRLFDDLATVFDFEDLLREAEERLRDREPSSWCDERQLEKSVPGFNPERPAPSAAQAVM